MVKITFGFFLFFSILGFSQSGKLLQGKVLSEGKVVGLVDVVNMNSKKSSTSDGEGNFSLWVTAGDELYFLTKDYADLKMVITPTDLNQNPLVISLNKKPVELEDVEIVKKSSLKVQITQGDIDAIKLSKQANALKVTNVYDGTIENGVDFVRMFKGIANWFKNKDKEKPEKPLPPITFKDYLAGHFDEAFYLTKLQLKPEEIALFIAYCEADSRAKPLAERQDLLEMADFLFEKNKEFKKLER
ncbi:hypothetical protein HKT18_00825 [Flavobacterium sp. IMCC34852]|uniref:Carboxypeptidase-like regulatory domain-containing protein n=1 Tax=Flavobacterium rivulicola TaxID=2732161 RepID=A0A7Y3R727_9FLAO|nr:hypothetical protein [Flavobacterium sp. IMCC34852]NNT70746.1 hypothetical protein [Flavobacterium sp. IMCC34852]